MDTHEGEKLKKERATYASLRSARHGFDGENLFCKHFGEYSSWDLSQDKQNALGIEALFCELHQY